MHVVSHENSFARTGSELVVPSVVFLGSCFVVNRGAKRNHRKTWSRVKPSRPRCCSMLVLCGAVVHKRKVTTSSAPPLFVQPRLLDHSTSAFQASSHGPLGDPVGLGPSRGGTLQRPFQSLTRSGNLARPIPPNFLEGLSVDKKNHARHRSCTLCFCWTTDRCQSNLWPGP